MAAAGCNVHLVTTSTLPRDRYSPQVQIETPIAAHNTGFSREGLDTQSFGRVLDAIQALTPSPPLPSSTSPASISGTPS